VAARADCSVLVWMRQRVWKGSFSFGLVSIPVRLFSAAEE
jgi:non-homologous end joining protein Ku